MLVPDLIRILHILTVVGSLLIGGGAIVVGVLDVMRDRRDSGQGMGMVFSGIMIVILGPLISRIYSEFLIVVFRIHEALASIEGKLGKEE